MAICPFCGKQYPQLRNSVIANAGSYNQCIGHPYAPGCRNFSFVPPPPYEYLTIPTPQPPRPLPIPQPRSPPSPRNLERPHIPTNPRPRRPFRVTISLTGGHCEEEEDDVYNDDLYILWAVNDSNGHRTTGSTDIVHHIDEGERFRFSGVNNIIYSGAPGEWIRFSLIAMESEESNNSLEIQAYWSVASFAAEYIPTVGPILSEVIRGINFLMSTFDQDDKLGEEEFHFDRQQIIEMSGSRQIWEFLGSNLWSDYHYKIHFRLDVD